jgi:hypothetical protein
VGAESQPQRESSSNATAALQLTHPNQPSSSTSPPPANCHLPTRRYLGLEIVMESADPPARQKQACDLVRSVLKWYRRRYRCVASIEAANSLTRSARPGSSIDPKRLHSCRTPRPREQWRATARCGIASSTKSVGPAPWSAHSVHPKTLLSGTRLRATSAR